MPNDPLPNTPELPPSPRRAVAHNTEKPVIIIGGGISGLSAAWFLHRKGANVRVLDSRSQPGGNLLTSRVSDYQLEHGPNSTLQKPGRPEDTLGRLIAALNIQDHLQVANEASSKRFVLYHGNLEPLPTSPPGMLTTPVFSWAAKLRLLKEPFIKPATEEESIAQFVRRRLGQEFLDYAIEPFISGVYAGNPDTLSVRAATRRIHEIEQQYGSLIRGAIALGRIAKGTGMPRGRLISFDEGMAFLPRAIVNDLPTGTFQGNAQVTGITPVSDGWEVSWQPARTEESAPSDAPPPETIREICHTVILATPAPVTARLIAPVSPPAAALLAEIPYAPIASIALGYHRKQITHPLDGFGFLVPRKERVRTLGALFTSTLFPARAPAGQVLLTAFIGGAMDTGNFLDQEDQQLVWQVCRDLSLCLDIQGKPNFVHLTRYTQAIPQYGMGHIDRIDRIDHELSHFPGLFTRANWRDGISVADCAYNGERLSAQVMQSL